MKKNFEQLVVFIAAYLFFLLTLAENFSGPHDSIRYLNGIVTGTELVNPHHLLYHFTARYWLLTMQPIFLGVKDYYLIESLTALCGSASVTVIYSFFRRRFGLSVPHSVAGILVAVFSYGFWFYSTNIEVYGPPLFFLLLALYILTRRVFSTADAWKVILLHCLAILFHQINILFIVVVLYKLWIERSHISFTRLVTSYAIAGILLVGGPYFLIGWFHEGKTSFASWLQWMEGYAKGTDYWQPLSVNTPVHVAYGFGHAFIGGHYIFQTPVVKGAINSSLSQHSLKDELFIARNLSGQVASFLSVLTAILGVIMIWLTVRFVKKFKPIVRNYPALITPLLLCGLIYSTFFCFWIPEILEFWLLQTILVWLLLIGTLPVTGFPLKINKTAGTGVIAGLLFAINFFGSIRWMQNIKNDWYYTQVTPLMPKATKRDVIVLQDSWILKDFLTYFTPSLTLAVSDSSTSTLDKHVGRALAHGGKIYVYPDVNKAGLIPDAHYIDSLLKSHAAYTRQYSSANPRIWVIEK